ncbi:hypothetical protein RPQ08_001754 [Campylobacter jejuni]|nr:hypothetical protein [Campylobacter coli]ELH1324561.1 hypothetical protein [Campylobacter jejuni]EKE4093853.1 hypothetical protein [Campylobacter coli]EKH7168438.1 hypothetical protein [Campylobacter coli]EKR5492193.1 hypothetical protein [Campylobacter coli]
MKKIISVLILALSLLNAKSFGESKKELVKLYNDLGSSYWYDFYCQAPFKVNKKGKYISFKVIYTLHAMNILKKVKSIKEQNT